MSASTRRRERVTTASKKPIRTAPVRRARSPRQGWRTAAESDPHELYESAVQDPGYEVKFIERAFAALRGRSPKSLREDFCGTHLLSMAWALRGKDRRAYGVDLDPAVLDWGRRRAQRRLNPAAQARLRAVRGNVLTHRGPRVDVLAAFNFSYYVFKRREQLRRYFRFARTHLVRDGVLFLDCYGGYASFSAQKEERHLDGFTYVWETENYDPITGDVLNHIHFRFPDRTRIRRAFTYDWRLWTIPEIRETLAEAGFRRTSVHWEGTDHATGGGNGVFRKAEHGEPCAGWIAYIVAEK
jgi:hypothetical protein